MIAEWAFSIINKGIVGSHKKKSFNRLKVGQQKNINTIIKQKIKKLWIFEYRDLAKRFS